MTFLVTGAAGFIGFHLCKRLLMEGETVVGIDSMNDYYDINLKKSRLEILYNLKSVNFIFVKEKLENKSNIFNIFQIHKPKYVINLAAQAGVRYSLENPEAYLNSNLLGFLNILEACKHNDINHFIYASSSSVYGGNINMPFSEKQNVDHPVSFYAATKKSNELIAHSYSHLYGIPSTGLRFFTVYGPWGRPDMALFIFTKSIILSEPINVFNNGKMVRDFTYIDDIIESLDRVIKKPPTENNNYDKKNIDPSTSWAPHKIFNIGNSEPVPLMKFIESIENALGRKAIKNFLPMQPGDVASTHADTALLEKWINYKPNTPIEKGIRNFVNWYKDFYK
tara:strand:+ start:752 stop:1762 length:1011 start_codon:yes stop_codon:yes gene_type:complete